MKRLFGWWMVGMVAVSSAGCSRVQTKVVQKPRVDQEVTDSQPGHNRGYLKGAAPATGDRRKTRDMLETNVELPTWQEMNPWRKGGKEEGAAAEKAAKAPAQAAVQEPMEQAPQEDYSIPASRQSEEQEPTVAASAGGDSYTIQKGDTLQKISKKFYGTTKKWYKIYRANYNTIKSPDRIRPGQTIMIPALAKSTEDELDQQQEGGNEYK